MEIENEKIIKIMELEVNTSVYYVIKTLLEVLNRWRKIKIFIVYDENKTGEIK